MKKIIRITESDLVGLVKRVIKEQSEVEESALTFGDKIKGKLGKLVGIPETSEEEKELAEEILAKVANGDYEILESYSSFVKPKGHEIRVTLNDGDYIVKIKKEMINMDASMTYTNITTPDGEQINILAKGYTNKLIKLIDRSDKEKKFTYPD